jgi:predicted small metal-binding protein
MKRLSCRDAGENCDEIFTGQTEDEVISKCRQHVKQHGISQWSSDMERKVRSLIRTT